MLNEANPATRGARPAVRLRATCREVAALVGAYLEEELGLGVRARIDDHLECCADCLFYLAGYRTTVRLLRAIPSADAELPEPLVHAILRAHNTVGRAVATPRSA